MIINSKKTPYRNLHVAVCGWGYIGKRHADIVYTMENTDLVAIVDNDVSVLAEAQAKYQNISFFNHINHLLDSGIPIDVICICTPNGVHAQQCLNALAYGTHLICEKPLALNSDDAIEIYNKSKQVNKNVFCVLQNRFSPPAQWLKSLVTSKKLGKIFQVHVNCFWNRDKDYYLSSKWRGKLELDGGPLFTQFSHFIDILFWLFGELKFINSHFGSFKHEAYTEFEDSGTIQFLFDENSVGSMSYSTCVWDKNFESSITIIGENGTIKIGGQYMNRIEYCHINDYEAPELPSSSPANHYGKHHGSANNHQAFIKDVIQIINSNILFDHNLKEAVRASKFISQVYQFRKTEHIPASILQVSI